MNKLNENVLIVVLFLASGLLGFLLSWYTHSRSASRPAVPVIQTFHYPTLFVRQLQGDPDAGKKIFKQFCGSCHDKQPLIDLNAPRLGDKAAWKARQKLGLPTLLKLTINGVGAMPARGGCFECSDDQLMEAIHYILDQSLSHKKIDNHD